MTRSRLKQLTRMAKTASPARARELYQEIMGAEAGPRLPVERVRASIIEACEELLAKGEP